MTAGHSGTKYLCPCGSASFSQPHLCEFLQAPRGSGGWSDHLAGGEAGGRGRARDGVMTSLRTLLAQGPDPASHTRPLPHDGRPSSNSRTRSPGLARWATGGHWQRSLEPQRARILVELGDPRLRCGACWTGGWVHGARPAGEAAPACPPF